MKQSMHNWMRPEPIEVTLERLHRLGYDSIEISGEPARYDWEEVRALLDKYEIECWGGVTMMFEGRDLLHPDKGIRIGTIAYMKDCIRMIKALRGEMFCIVPSVVGKVKPMASSAEEWAWAVEGLKEVAAFAQDNGIKTGIEPLNRFETYFINRHDQALLLAEEVGHDLRVVLDAFHINIEEADWKQAIRNVGERLLDFHVADNNRRPCGQGRYDWSEVIGILKEVNYQGPLTAEFVLTIDHTPLAVSSEKHESDQEFTEADIKFIRHHGSGLISAADYDKAAETSIRHLKSAGA
ncbi:MAG: sugar phosphate isomerase/epimerase family protein [Blastocatellales bacterium]